MLFTLFVVSLIAASCGCAVANSPDLQERLGLRLHTDPASAAIQNEEEQYQQLMDELPAQRAKVATLIAAASSAKQELERRQARVVEIARRYEYAVGLPHVEKSTLDAYCEQFADARAAVDKQRAQLAGAQTKAREAQDGLNVTDQSLRRIKDLISSERVLLDLAIALEINEDAINTAKTLMCSTSVAGKAGAELDRLLNEARARNDLAKGTVAERELDKLDNDDKLRRGKEELERLFNGDVAVKQEVEVLLRAKQS